MEKIWARIRKDINDLWAAAAAIAAYTVFMNLFFHAFCPMVILTGFPCPGCGMTRAVFYFITGRLWQSVQMNPMGIPAVCLIFYFLWNRYIVGRRAKGMRLFIGTAFFLLLCVYAWRMFRFFPNRVPYVYTDGNIFSGIFPFYQQILHEWNII